MLELDGVTVEYGDLTAVNGVSLSVADGELFCLLGPSGSGKSTVLRAVAGFERPTAGQIRLNGTDVTTVPPYDRDCSMVFQDWALFPEQSVLENVAFGPKMAGVDETARHTRAREMLELVEMGGYEDAQPAQLSGGQKQRVALARSLAVEPDLLLLDEPLSNLDRQLRETMQLELKRIHERVGTTMLYVTHDQDEAFTLGDRLAIMNRGRLVQVGEPARVYEEPAEEFVESFLGSTNFFDCQVLAVDERPTLETPTGGEFRPPISATGVSAGDEVTVSVRPEHLTVEPASADGGTVEHEQVVLTATVTETIHRGASVRIYLTAGDADLFVERPVAAGTAMTTGDALRVGWDPADATYFDAAGERLQ
jgi:spermidine/putrescine transport system ATP-binding protein